MFTIHIQQSLSYGAVLRPVARRRKEWIPRNTFLGTSATPADGVQTVFNAPANFDLSPVNGTVATASTGDSVFTYSDVFPLNPNSATFYVQRSEASPTGKVAIFSQPPVPMYDSVTNEALPTAVNFFTETYEVVR
jgi:hypothetical protein